MYDFRWPALVTLGMVALLFLMAINVGRARMKYGVAAPATSSEKAARVAAGASAVAVAAPASRVPFVTLGR